jgi:hypothetical protein
MDHARLLLLPIQTSILFMFSTSQPDPLSTMLMEDHQAQLDHHSHKLSTFFWLNNQDQHAPQLLDLARPVLLLLQILIPLTYSTFQPDQLLIMLMEDLQDQLGHHSHKLLTFF